METNIIEKLNITFRKVFKDPQIKVNPEMTANDVEKWDSITHVVLIAEIEKDFNIKFKLKELIAMKNVGDCIRIVKEKLEN